MSPGIGYAKGLTNDIPMQGQGASPSRLSPQQAIKILSLRVPETLPSNAPVSRSLLTSPGGAAPGAQGLNSLIAQLVQAFKPSQEMASPQQASPLPSRQIPNAPFQAPVLDAQQGQMLPPQGQQAPEFVGDANAPEAPPLFEDGSNYGPDALNAFFNADPFNDNWQRQNAPTPKFIWGEDDGKAPGLFDEYGTPLDRRFDWIPSQGRFA